MELYINDLSLRTENSIYALWEPLISFSKTIDRIQEVCNCSVKRPENIWDTCIADYVLNTMSFPNGTKLGHDMENFLVTLISKFPKGESSEKKFSLTSKFEEFSTFIAYAVENDISIISLPLDVFRKNKIDGYIGLDEKNNEKTSVDNFYGEGDDFLNRIPYEKVLSIEKDALKQPLWNQTFITEYLKDVKFDNLGNNEKNAKIIKLGTRIAEMNGWQERPDLNKINSIRSKDPKKNKIRHIFYSANFATEAYLSIDIEGLEVRFELCDSKGRHKGELNVKGELDESKKSSDHDIKLKA